MVSSNKRRPAIIGNNYTSEKNGIWGVLKFVELHVYRIYSATDAVKIENLFKFYLLEMCCESSSIQQHAIQNYMYHLKYHAMKIF